MGRSLKKCICIWSTQSAWGRYCSLCVTSTTVLFSSLSSLRIPSCIRWSLRWISSAEKGSSYDKRKKINWSLTSLLCVYRWFWTYQKNYIGGLIKCSSHTDSLPLASRKNNALERGKNRKKKVNSKAVLITHLNKNEADGRSCYGNRSTHKWHVYWSCWLGRHSLNEAAFRHNLKAIYDIKLP